ncbi:unnamed protein product [Haemonchus placei]|uniref:HTH_Tnp_Tc3_2 domain-containing protein n=1 Tax=Haemonchus placei TaxID=6290 RepID=A0A3P7X887_HAEPC|nr:unnamed protein product [Haemonchus placei]
MQSNSIHITKRKVFVAAVDLAEGKVSDIAVDIAAEFNASNATTVSRQTVGRRLNSAGIYGRRPAKKPLITMKNRRARVDFARRYLKWTSADWGNVLFTDESKFNLFGSDGIRFARRPRNERYNPRYTRPTVKHGGGSVMVYGAISMNGMGPFLKISGVMTGKSYRDMIINAVLPWAQENTPPGWVLQQDNDPKHTSRAVKAAFQEQQVTVLEWPSQSPDLNPIEHI